MTPIKKISLAKVFIVSSDSLLTKNRYYCLHYQLNCCMKNLIQGDSRAVPIGIVGGGLDR